MLHSRFIKEEAFRLGFVACGLSRAEPLDVESEYLSGWLQNGMHGRMSYMERNIEKRTDPGLLVPGAKTVISLAVNYYPIYKQPPDVPRIAKYAYGKDYHFVVKDMLFSLLESIRKEYGTVSGRAFTDSAPVMEHAWAARSGLGWIGKHSLIIHPGYGSYIFLGELIIDLEFEPDRPLTNRCGTCTRCMDACPTGAIVEPSVVDARKCISYQTIEYRDGFDPGTMLHHCLFGCDICQDACPYNRKATPSVIADFAARTSLLEKSGSEWENMTEEEFEKLAKDSPLQRAGLELIKRNLRSLS